MARIRTIKPEFFTSLAIADLTPTERLAFIGLWTYVDDEGRGVNDPRLIKAAIFPLDVHIDTQTCAHAVQKLRDKGLIRVYERDGKPLLCVTNWSEHQRISHPTPSKLPAPDGRRPPRPSRKVPESSGEVPESFANAPESLRPERKGKERKGKEHSLSSPSVLQEGPIDPDERERLGTLIKGLFNGNGDDPHAELRAKRKADVMRDLDGPDWEDSDGVAFGDGSNW